MPDKYDSFSELANKEKEGEDFRVRLRKRHGTTVIIAPHGGGIEPGTSEIAEAIAGDEFSFYAFEGIKPTGNGDLHITSIRFDESKCIALVIASPTAISIHGEDSERQIVFLGGRDAAMLRRLRDSLLARGFSVETHHSSELQGTHENNICNRGKRGCLNYSQREVVRLRPRDLTNLSLPYGKSSCRQRELQQAVRA